jgi:(2R)-3-sulfolactate dehydrogenase (NADP+)
MRLPFRNFVSGETFMNEIRLPPADAEALVAAALEASNTSVENAASVARALIGAELCGQGGHGLRRAPAYAAQAKAGKVNGRIAPEVNRIKPGSISVDAGFGFAFPALEMAIGTLAEIAPEQGIAAAGIFRSHHAGVAGLTVEALAERGLVALFFSNAPGAMAPWGGSRPLFGTNPIAFACPSGKDGPVVVDVSLSRVARGKVMAASQKGEAIPEGWAFDKGGHPTTDPDAALAGTMAALGDAKGAALALMVELLAAGLTGANYGYEQTSFFDDKGLPPGTGQLLIAVEPSAFGQGAVARFAEMAQAVAGTQGARLPGARRRDMRQRFLKDGIPADPKLVDEIRRIGAA